MPRAYWRQPNGPGSSIKDKLEYPAVHISYNDAKAYCKWRDMRLPTETEWDYAARGGLHQQEFPWGGDLMDSGTLWRMNIWQGDFPKANDAADGFASVCPADAYEPNAYGLYNMLGNVWEWCATKYDRDAVRGALFLSGTAFGYFPVCAAGMCVNWLLRCSWRGAGAGLLGMADGPERWFGLASLVMVCAPLPRCDAVAAALLFPAWVTRHAGSQCACFCGLFVCASFMWLAVSKGVARWIVHRQCGRQVQPSCERQHTHGCVRRQGALACRRGWSR